MAFDQATRNRLQRFVTDTRRILEEEFTRQLQNDLGMDPASGDVTPIENLPHINVSQLETARIMRDTLSHYCASPGTDARSGLDRIVREQAFTVLNRLAALRMAEARGLLIESVGNGYQAKGFQLYVRLAGAGLGETGDAYRVYLQSVFDELSQDLPGLFDRYSPQGRLFPREAALMQVLGQINHGEIDPLWAEDETIGWIYQYFNSKEERKAMRDASQAPRNSRELAVRNQFFTPRYVVEFLVDNTLGRLWFNWTGGQTALRDRCQYLLVKPDERPEATERLRDPRTIKLLDPACGSMHFGLYAFDLFQEIYREAWDWEQAHGPGVLDRETGGSPDLKPLADTYADHDAYLCDVPRLIIEHNIYGVDIDPRAAQIASLALWLRAQRAWHNMGVKAQDRPQVGQGQVVAAVAPPAEVDLRKRFMEELDPLDAELFEQTLFMLKGLPELGVLLQVEKELPALVRKVFGEYGALFQSEDMAQWQKAEFRLRDALTDYARATRSAYQNRLFADDVLQGLRMIDHCHEQYDVVVMNPPFGEFSESQRDYAKEKFISGSHDILTAFVEIGIRRLRDNGLVGAITSRTAFFAPTTKSWREDSVLKYQIQSWIDLGEGVLDDAMVETCAYTIEKTIEREKATFFSLDKRSLLACAAAYRSNEFIHGMHSLRPSVFKKTKGSPFCYWLEPELLDISDRHHSLEKAGVRVSVGLQTGDDFRFIRCWWELSHRNSEWILHAKGGENEPFATDIHLAVNWVAAGKEMKAQRSIRLNAYSKVEPSRGLPAGLTFSYRTHRFSPAIMPRNTITGVAGMGIFSDHIDLPVLATILNSSTFNELVDVRLGLREINALYQAGVIAPVPFPDIDSEKSEKLGAIGEAIWKAGSQKFYQVESSLSFRGFFFDRRGIQETSKLINEIWFARVESIIDSFAKIDKLVGEYYGLSADISDRIHQRNLPLFKKSFPERLTTPEIEGEKLVSMAMSRSFGRYSDLIEIDEMISDEDMNAYLHGFGDNFIDRVSSKTTKDCVSTRDVVESLNNLLQEIFEGPAAVGEELLRITNQHTLESYVTSPTGFFVGHLKRFSRSRRKAPIFWPISTASNSYTLWLYYPNLTNQTLYTAVNDFVDPKLKRVSHDAATLRAKGTARSREDEKALEILQTLELELIELRDTLLRIAPTYRPNHEDGVQITAAPLWQLFRHKSWQETLKDTWAKLEKGEYDWAHLAMANWPDRVREKCKTDKSLAIAHDLEQLYVEAEPKTPHARGRKKGGAA
jgi:hypothetical protein